MVFTYAAIGLALAFVCLLFSLHVLKPDFDPAWRWISEYEIGRVGWIEAGRATRSRGNKRPDALTADLAQEVGEHTVEQHAEERGPGHALGPQLTCVVGVVVGEDLCARLKDTLAVASCGSVAFTLLSQVHSR